MNKLTLTESQRFFFGVAYLLLFALITWGAVLLHIDLGFALLPVILLTWCARKLSPLPQDKRLLVVLWIISAIIILSLLYVVFAPEYRYIWSNLTQRW